MKTFHGSQEIKDALLVKLRAHAKADQFVKGRYWENGKGCAVGCTIESGDHSLYESRFGIPQMLARFEDSIFEGSPNARAMTWPIRFIESIPVGKDLSNVGWQMLAWIVRDCNPVPSPSTQEVLDILDAMGHGEAVCQERKETAIWAASCAVRWAASCAVRWAASCAVRWAASCAASYASYASCAASDASATASAASCAARAASDAARAASDADFWERASKKLLELMGDPE